LKRCVDALLSISTDHAWEIVIVDNGSTDGTSDYLALIDQQYFGRVKVTATLEPKRGLSVARIKDWQTAK
jgi:glycosyltransferase involved in cell wall biosynthesis